MLFLDFQHQYAPFLNSVAQMVNVFLPTGGAMVKKNARMVQMNFLVKMNVRGIFFTS